MDPRGCQHVKSIFISIQCAVVKIRCVQRILAKSVKQTKELYVNTVFRTYFNI